MAKKKTNMIIIGAIVVLAIILVVNNGGLNLFTISPTGTVNRVVSNQEPGENIDVTLEFVGGTGQFGGIVAETIPSGFTVMGITSTVLGVSGSASGKLTGSVFEIAFAADNVATPSITYTLSSSLSDGQYPISGTFEYAEGGPSGTTGGEQNLEYCTAVCTRPADLCIAQSSDGCWATCDWIVTQNSLADVDCDNLVTNTELLSAITDWVNDVPPFDVNTVLLDAITAWVNS